MGNSEMMLRIHCTGSPYEIGFKHGNVAKDHIRRSLEFYSLMFKQYTGKDWQEILPIASSFGQHVRTQWPRFHHEMEGIAAGARCNIENIYALNVRTEIAFGLLKTNTMSDGCTSLAWKSETQSLLGQNWDWMEEQRENMILITIEQEGFPTIQMVTEAGIIGKIGMNSAGVGVCLNAIRCTGLDPKLLPVHLALRICLESTSAAQAVTYMEEVGVASSAHILVADRNGAIGLEFTSKTVLKLTQELTSTILHTNHMILDHNEAEEFVEPDSCARLHRLEEMIRNRRGVSNVELSNFHMFFDDHDGFPESICRSQEGPSKDATLFNIVMDLIGRRAVLRIGKVCKTAEVIQLEF